MGNKELVSTFLEVVRSGKQPERAREFFATTVVAHQVRSEGSEAVERSPDNYADHVRKMVEVYGAFRFEIEELLADGDLVYARWRQEGLHLGEVEGYPPTGRPVVEVASCVYRVEKGLIAEYWIQLDRAGLLAQLETPAVL